MTVRATVAAPERVEGGPVFAFESMSVTQARILQDREEVRERIARAMLFIFATVCVGIVAVFAGFVLIVSLVSVDAQQMQAVDRLLTLLSASLLPAVVGILGSVMGFYFGAQQRPR